jgi:TRAP-type C4-dicarboxylate transport system permease small subunit
MRRYLGVIIVIVVLIIITTILTIPPQPTTVQWIAAVLLAVIGGLAAVAQIADWFENVGGKSSRSSDATQEFEQATRPRESLQQQYNVLRIDAARY